MNGCATPLLGGLLVFWLSGYPTCGHAGGAGLPTRAHVRVIADSEVVPERRNALIELASQLRVRVDHIDIEARDDVRAWLTGTDLVISDAPSAHGKKELQERIIPALMGTQTPWLRVGGGRPQFGNISPLHARRLTRASCCGWCRESQANVWIFRCLADRRVAGRVFGANPFPADRHLSSIGT